MRIVCPTCSAAYEVPDSLLGTGRPVRCARCTREWVPETATQAAPGNGGSPSPPVLPPPLSVVERSALDRSGLGEPSERPARPIAPPLVEIEPLAPIETSPLAEPVMPEPALSVPPEDIRDPRKVRRENTIVRLAWAASILLLVVLAWAAYGWRAEIMHAWPASERLYAAFGLAELSK